MPIQPHGSNWQEYSKLLNISDPIHISFTISAYPVASSSRKSSRHQIGLQKLLKDLRQYNTVHLLLYKPLDRPSRSLHVAYCIQALRVALTSRKCSSSQGPDGVLYATLCHLGDRAWRWLLNLFTLSWGTGSAFEEWIVAEVIPILKRREFPLEKSS